MFVLAVCLLGVLVTGSSASPSAAQPRISFVPDGIGMVDPGTGEWHLRAADGYATSFYFGNPGDVPFMGDWDCDGVDTPGLYRQSDGFVYLRNSNTAGIADIRFFFGNPGDVPLAGDFDGDACDTVSLYRPSESRVFIIDRLGSEDAGLGAADLDYVFGDPGDKPFVGDFDGDGTDTLGVYRPSVVHINNSHSSGPTEPPYLFGDPGDQFVVGDWSGLGFDGPGTFRPLQGKVFLRNQHSNGLADDAFAFGSPGMIPVAGKFGVAAPGFAARSWEVNRIEPPMNAGWFVDLIVGADGRPLLGHGWITGFIPDPGAPDLNAWELAFTKCVDHACTTAHTTSTGKPLSDHVSLTLGIDDLPIATYHDPATAQLVFAHCEDPACANVTYQAQVQVGHPFEHFGKLADIGIGGDTFPFAAYLLSHNTSYWLVKCGDITCSTSTSTIIGGVGDFHRPAVTRGPHGNPLVVRYGSAPPSHVFSLFFEECADPGCVEGDVAVLAEWPGESTFWDGKGTPALMLGSDGLPIVAFNDLSFDVEDGVRVDDFSLDVVHCEDAKCSLTTRSTIDTGHIGFVSMAMGGDGLPIIGYQAEGGVRVAKCLDVACSSATVTTVQSGSAAYESLIVDPLGMPVIAYRDKIGLKVARLAG